MTSYNKNSIKEKISELINILKERPALVFIVTAFVLVSIFYMFFAVGQADYNNPTTEEVSIAFDEDIVQMTGVKESVDPRDVWAATLTQKVEITKEELAKKIIKDREDYNLELNILREDLHSLRTLLIEREGAIRRKEAEDNIRLSSTLHPPSSSSKLPKTKSIGFFSKQYKSAKKNSKEYVASGSFARAVLMTGVVVGTGSNSISNPEPVMMRLTDAGIFSKNLRTEQIKEAILIGDCSGDLSSERAKCRLQTLSLENYKGEIIERPVQGWIVGEDGRNGVKGIVIDKSSEMLRMAMLNGVLGGMSGFFKNKGMQGIYPISPISGQQNTLGDLSTLKVGAASGAGDAFAKMADFIMDRFNSMSPQIVISSGREVDVVFRAGVDLNGEFIGEVSGRASSSSNMGDNLSNNNGSTEVDYSNYRDNSFNDVISQMNTEISKNNMENVDGF